MRDRTKNYSDLRYKKAQSAIDRVLGRFVKKGHVAGLKVSEISKAAKINKSTFYDHHSTLDDAIFHLDYKMQTDLEKIYQETLETNCSLSVLYHKILYFICKHKNYYDIAIKTGDHTPFLVAIEISKPFVLKNWSKVKNKERAFTLFEWHICGILWWWGKNDHFSERKIRNLAKELVALANF